MARTGIALASEVEALEASVATKAEAAALTAHTASTSNPHGVTAAQAGALGLTGGTLTGPLTVSPGAVGISGGLRMSPSGANNGAVIASGADSGYAGCWVNNTGAGYGLLLQNRSTGRGATVENYGSGHGINVVNANTASGYAVDVANYKDATAGYAIAVHQYSENVFAAIVADNTSAKPILQLRNARNDTLGVSGQTGTGDFLQCLWNNNVASQETRFRVDQYGNARIGHGATAGGGAGVLGFANAATVPNSNPAGGVLYVESGALKYRGSAGTITPLANA